MENKLVYGLLVDSAEKWANHPAIYDEFGIMTFSELLNEVDNLAEELGHLGIIQGMGVGVMARNSRTFIIGVFAVLARGAAVLPISHQLKKNEIDEIIAETGLHAVIDDQSGIQPLATTAKLIELTTSTVRFGWTTQERSAIFAPHVKAPAFIRFTSGTTGSSKGVIIGNKAVLERTEAANKSLNLSTESAVVWVLPMAYHFVVSIVLYVRYGAAICIVKDFMAPSVIEMTNRYNGTMLYASPMQIRLLAADRGTEMMPSLTKVISTSAGIDANISKAFYQRFQKTVQQAFGIIEIGLPIVNTEISEDSLDAVGYALPDFDVQVFDENNQPLPTGKEGALAIKGPGIFDAYLSPPTLCRDLLVNGYFLTADYASIDEKGLIRILGRKKSMINVSGNKVFAEEVEKTLEQLPYIQLARVSGVPHRLMGQIIQAEVVLHGVKEIDVEEVLSYCRKRLSTFKIPQKIIIVDELPLTKTGKVQRH